ncbi:hypothetical protein AGABI1DRAFT_107020 [Agaricus bisporus var. burnettii JB137-S8]|uniref:Nephrocystin 3-like N-terminal domain-containing protein n=1 Tax=Agaricus bisporus var. burnettii (strain JB137-S8 / ATCC MYA-4627 / FGSC 10392) TaxID=597362 RepID=K5X8T1_AGABU|nr:uncharacterized protein AGABI1DRAFT_107020 [Agaricus bisporus var. burnettii JB137-S8]EKM79588.1 hypothetical protein AGABI1DRAFT_107020 [Agaricus bisporus var. burnettii JB137-S8]
MQDPQTPELFNNTSDFILNGPVFFDIQRTEVIQNIHNHIRSSPNVLERLLTCTCPDAAVGSNAQHTPQRHLRERTRISGILLEWVNNPNRERKMIWLNGFEGTGKTVIAQTFAETCLANGLLGASYFFSQKDGRTKADLFILTIVYHLTIHCPEYGSIVADIISEDLSTLYKSRRSQMRQLIVEPFLLLLSRQHEISQKPLLIVVDGLDECDEIDVQRELIEMICEVLRQEPDLPLLWLVASRPEPDLEPLSWRDDLISVCSSLQVVDEDAEDNINQFPPG